jgi:hypothetical protein
MKHWLHAAPEPKERVKRCVKGLLADTSVTYWHLPGSALIPEVSIP